MMFPGVHRSYGWMVPCIISMVASEYKVPSIQGSMFPEMSLFIDMVNFENTYQEVGILNIGTSNPGNIRLWEN